MRISALSIVWSHLALQCGAGGLLIDTLIIVHGDFLPKEVNEFSSK